MALREGEEEEGCSKKRRHHLLPSDCSLTAVCRLLTLPLTCEELGFWSTVLLSPKFLHCLTILLFLSNGFIFSSTKTSSLSPNQPVPQLCFSSQLVVLLPSKGKEKLAERNTLNCPPQIYKPTCAHYHFCFLRSCKTGAASPLSLGTDLSLCYFHRVFLHPFNIHSTNGH